MKEWTTIDKTDWPRGEWDGEPDTIHWTDNASGFECVMRRNPAGSWCGFVAVPSEHPDFGRHYSAISVTVPGGGLISSAMCAIRPDQDCPVHGIRHVPPPQWWLGFCYARTLDVTPALSGLVPDVNFFGGAVRSTYKNRALVEHAVHDLAVQLMARGHA